MEEIAKCLSAIKREKAFQACRSDLRDVMDISDSRYFQYDNFLNCEANVTRFEAILNDILVNIFLRVLFFNINALN